MLPDREARRAAEDPGLSSHVEAPAGSGKTSLLVNRYLSLLGQVEHPEEILALTFTNKAAGEMRQRVFSVLESARQGQKPADDLTAHRLALARRAWQGQKGHEHRLRSPQSLGIMTFHGFCLRLLSLAPAQAGLPLDAAVLPDLEQAQAAVRSVEGLVVDLLAGRGPEPLCAAFARRLLRLNGNLDALRRELADIAAGRDLFADLEKEARGAGSDRELAGRLQERLGHLVEARLQELHRLWAGSEMGQGWAGFREHLLAQGASLGAELPAGLPAPSWRSLAAWQAMAEALLTKGGTPRQRFGPKSGFYAGFAQTAWADLIKELDPGLAELLHQARRLPLAGQEQAQAGDLADLLALGSAAITRLQESLLASSGLDYVELEERALRLLEAIGPGGLDGILDRQIKHILVDEFQDTSRPQWELLRALCASWRHGDGRTLFVVGDPKQSIYGFRKAEVALFLEAKSGLPLESGARLGLRNLTLQTNFRSAGGLLDWCNGFFASLMASPRAEFDEVPFGPCKPPPGQDREPGAPPVRLGLIPRSAPEPRTQEARWIAQQVAALLERPHPPGSIAILTFTRAPMAEYLAALEQAGVAVAVKEGFPLAQSPSAAHLLNLARALLRPHDDLAWAGLLRAPWAWQPMARLHQTAQATGADWWQKLRAAGSEQPELAPLCDALAQGFKDLGHQPLARVVERMWLALEGPRKVAQEEGPKGVESCLAMLGLLAEADQGLPQASLARAEAMLEGAYQPPDPRAADSPVSMMTVHGAKGLEFDAVLVPLLDRDPTSLPPEAASPSYRLARVPGRGEHLMALRPDRRFAEPDQVYDLLGDLERGRTLAEAKRLLYVACTRARQELYLSGLVQLKDEALSAGRRSYLTWLLDHEGLGDLALAAGGRSPISGLAVDLWQRPLKLPAHKEERLPDRLPAPPVIDPEAPAYLLSRPSQLKAEGPQEDQRPGAEEYDEVAGRGLIARGVVVHRLLERAAQGDGLPGVELVVGALEAEGLAAGPAREQAPGVLAEASRCLEDPFLSRLLQTEQPLRRTEWSLEAMGDQGEVYTGFVDLVVNDGNRWWVLDYKTSRPEPGEEAGLFEKRLLRRYRAQMESYVLMVCRACQVDRDQVSAGLYLTALPKWLPMEL